MAPIRVLFVDWVCWMTFQNCDPSGRMYFMLWMPRQVGASRLLLVAGKKLFSSHPPQCLVSCTMAQAKYDFEPPLHPSPCVAFCTIAEVGVYSASATRTAAV